jgi:phytoene desaturase
MNYADFVLGTWYPKGGMVKIVEAMVALGKELGVNYVINSNVSKINVEKGVVKGITIDDKFISSDFVLSGADYAHTETLLDDKSRQYSAKYWDKKVFAPSSLLFYVGFDKKLTNVRHHNLFFDKSFDKHAAEIYDTPKWPKDPLFYASFPSLTDNSVAPDGKECAFFLVPLAPGLKTDKELPNIYFKALIKRLEEQTNQELEKHVLFKIPFSVEDFKKEYNSYKGNAYGMANTLMQTAFLRPGIKSKTVKNLFFTGQLTVPGPGVPPALISGKIVSEQIIKKAIKTSVS